MKTTFTLLFLIILLNISHAQNNTWTWLSGSNFNGQRGVYGSKGVAAAANTPGARGSSVTWKDQNGIFWLFGGLGYDVNGSQGFLNDLWKWDGTNWTWVSGSNTINPAGVYGTKGVTNATNIPPAKTNSIGWIDGNNNLWVFGGQGNTSNYMSDLWKWDGTNWTWVSGSSTANTASVYGTKGVTNSANVPGARESSMGWIDDSGNFWLFGGDNAVNGTLAVFNDLWKWDGANWTWINGSNLTNQTGVYGVQGTTASTNQPGARNIAASWKDANGNFWVFGGYGFSLTSGSYTALNDLWKWDGTNWTWISGNNNGINKGIYGTKNITASTNMPGSRWGAASWIDKNNNFWLWGGHGNEVNGVDGILNDLWKWDGVNWTWVSGANISAQPGIYGVKGTSSPTNVPGSRADAVSWIDNSGNLYLFGGFYWNDLWKFDLNSSVLPVSLTSLSGSLVNKKTILRWATATETNNKGFFVERSTDASIYNQIGFVAGHGTVSQPKNYVYTDSFPLSGKNFYRLKQTDLDGRINYSSTIEVDVASINHLNVYPNPANGYINISTTDMNGKGFRIIDLSGKLIKTGIINSNNMQVDIKNLPAATYILKTGDASILFMKN